MRILKHTAAYSRVNLNVRTVNVIRAGGEEIHQPPQLYVLVGQWCLEDGSPFQVVLNHKGHHVGTVHGYSGTGEVNGDRVRGSTNWSFHCTVTG